MTDVVTLQADEHSRQDLSQWLRQEPMLRDARIGTAGATPRPGEMGWGADALQVVADKDLLIVLATTIGAWLSSRFRPTKIKIEYRGRTVEVESSRDAEGITRRILDDLEEPDEPDEPDDERR